MPVDRNRIEEIKVRKKNRENKLKKKIFLMRRFILAAVLISILALIVFGVRSCVNSIEQKKADEAARIAAEEAAKPTPEPTPFFNEYGINETFYDDCAFLGNSFIDGMLIYDLVPGADYFSKIGLNVSQVMTDTLDGGTVPVIEEFNADKKYERIFLMFGENEVGWIGDSFFDRYQVLVDKIKEYQPQAKLCLLAVTPISKKVSDEDFENLNIDRVKEYNEKIKALALENGIDFGDIFTPLADKDGFLPADAATDGIHFGKDYYIKCLKYIQENCV